MYSAFSLRSPSAAASATCCVTRGRSTSHSSSSSARSFFAPSGVMYATRFCGCFGGSSPSLSGADIASAYPVCCAPARMGMDLLIVLALLTCNGIFAGAEIAILSVRKTRLAEFIRRRDKRALAVKSLRDNPERFLATVQVCITTFGTAASVFGGASLEPILAHQLTRVGLGHATQLVIVVTM